MKPKGGVNRIARRVSALERLEKQLTVGTKTVKCIEATDGGSTWIEQVPLTGKDITRIVLEIQILKKRI
jgi:hypothetical protein